MLKIGDSAPDFNLPDQFGKAWRLKDYQGKYLLLYFYPRDFTPGCTKEACSFRDSFPRFKSSDMAVVGISTDTIQSHRKFVDKYQLPFTLLADTDKEMVKNYEVWQPKKFMGREFMGTQRTSYLISPHGKIVKIYQNVNPLVHSNQVEKDLSEL